MEMPHNVFYQFFLSVSFFIPPHCVLFIVFVDSSNNTSTLSLLCKGFNTNKN